MAEAKRALDGAALLAEGKAKRELLSSLMAELMQGADGDAGAGVITVDGWVSLHQKAETCGTCLDRLEQEIGEMNDPAAKPLAKELRASLRKLKDHSETAYGADIHRASHLLGNLWTDAKGPLDAGVDAIKNAFKEDPTFFARLKCFSPSASQV